jgi:hypothetical protein
MVSYDEMVVKLDSILAFIQRELASGTAFLRIDRQHRFYIFTWQEHDLERRLQIEFSKRYPFKQVERAFYAGFISDSFIKECKEDPIYQNLHPSSK